MSTIKETLKEEMDALRTRRDELRVHAHLGRAEIKDLWADVETKWNRLEGEVKRLGAESKEPLQEISLGLSDLMAQLREGYRRVGAALERKD